MGAGDDSPEEIAAVIGHAWRGRLFAPHSAVNRSKIRGRQRYRIGPELISILRLTSGSDGL